MKKEIIKEQQNLALLLLLWRLPGTIASFLAAITSRSLLVWMEFVEEASIIIPGIIILLIFQELKKNLKFKYNYGTGKVEAITALCCEMFDIAGILCICVLAIRRIIHPHAEESKPILALILTILGIFFDIFMLKKEQKLSQTVHSKMLHTAYLSAQKEFAFEFLVVISLLIEILIRGKKWQMYISPIASLILSVPFIIILFSHIKDSLYELADRTLDEESQMKILKVMSEFYDSYESFGAINSRIVGDHKHIDIELNFDPDTTFREINDLVSKMTKRLKEEIGHSTINIIVKGN